MIALLGSSRVPQPCRKFIFSDITRRKAVDHGHDHGFIEIGRDVVQAQEYDGRQQACPFVAIDKGGGVITPAQ